MDTQFHPTLYRTCAYLSIQGLKLIRCKIGRTIRVLCSYIYNNCRLQTARDCSIDISLNVNCRHKYQAVWYVHTKKKSSIWQLCRHWEHRYRYDNLRCHQWRQNCQMVDLLFSVFFITCRRGTVSSKSNAFHVHLSINYTVCTGECSGDRERVSSWFLSMPNARFLLITLSFMHLRNSFWFCLERSYC